MNRLKRFVPLFLLLTAASPTGRLDVEITGMRNSAGMLRACLTSNQRAFPDCSHDARALKVNLPASARRLSFEGFPPGRYALTVVHDANGNEKLDTTLGIPREGFGFSRNPRIRFGAPKFKQVDIELGPGLSRQSVRMQYML